jgi:D-sedoheptulose 7-phosphate isomerase
VPSTVEDGQPAAELVEEDLRFAAREAVKLQDSLGELTAPGYISALALVAATVARCIQNGGTVLVSGNDGSAADARHLAAELVGRQNYDPAPAAGIALSADTSVLTAISNDYGYEDIFARQLAAIGREGDVLVGISTSGRSKNVVAALLAGQEAGISTVALTGRDRRDMSNADLVLAMPSDETAKVHEPQLVAGHMMFALVERALFPRQT